MLPVVEPKLCLETDVPVTRGLARQELDRYMILTIYRNIWLRIGFTESDLADCGSDIFSRCDGALGRCRRRLSAA